MKWLYAWFLAFHLLFVVGCIGAIGAWFILAAVLEPAKFLPQGVVTTLL